LPVQYNSANTETYGVLVTKLLVYAGVVRGVTRSCHIYIRCMCDIYIRCMCDKCHTYIRWCACRVSICTFLLVKPVN
jgi:hypothetical protein